MERELERVDRFVEVARREEVKREEGTIVFVETKRLALFEVDGEVVCIKNSCPHAGGHLGRGSVKGCKVFCPRHDWAFDLTTGACETDPRYSVKRYAVKVEDGSVWVGIPESF